jgi:glycosyltransferase involved in cell wall biosynthesis
VIINQWVPAAHKGDAIGDSARHMRDLLRGRGYQSDIFALTVDEDLRGEVLDFHDADARRGDVTLLHFALPSPMTEPFATLRGVRVLQYHNVTPAWYFAPFDTGLFRLATLARRELATLAGRVDLALGVSEFNRSELDALGFERTGVMTLSIDLGRLVNAPRRPTLEDILDDDRLTNILFVGRIAPNKRIEDVIRLAEHYKRYVDAECRFIFVGRYDAVPRYYAMVRALIDRYRMLHDRFLFPGPVPDADLATYYRLADAYVSLSEHEGFCAPLVEAMAMDVPVLAYGAAAVPETLGGAGVEFFPKDLEFASEALGALVFDDGVREQVLAGQRERVKDFGDARTEQELDKWLRAIA